MNPRQKKRSSQARKKYHESAKKQEAVSRQASSQKLKESTGRETNPTDKPQAPVPRPSKTDHMISHDSQPEKKSFSKRKVTSNWSRYDEGDEATSLEGTHGYLRTTESEQELQQRLVQLLHLPVQTHTPDFKDNYSLLDNKEGSQFINLDCQSLADSLSSIPVHKRLDISVELLELGGYVGVVDTNESHADNRETSTPDLKETATEGHVSQDSMQIKMTENVSVGAQVQAQDFDFHLPVNKDIKENPKLLERSQRDNTHVITNEDSELDELLVHQTTCSQTAVPSSVSDGGVTSEQLLADPQKSIHETDELDDMLDELLS